jgi:hypothetical protein
VGGQVERRRAVLVGVGRPVGPSSADPVVARSVPSSRPVYTSSRPTATSRSTAAATCQGAGPRHRRRRAPRGRVGSPGASMAASSQELVDASVVERGDRARRHQAAGTVPARHGGRGRPGRLDGGVDGGVDLSVEVGRQVVVGEGGGGLGGHGAGVGRSSGGRGSRRGGRPAGLDRGRCASAPCPGGSRAPRRSRRSRAGTGRAAPRRPGTRARGWRARVDLVAGRPPARRGRAPRPGGGAPASAVIEGPRSPDGSAAAPKLVEARVGGHAVGPGGEPGPTVEAGEAAHERDQAPPGWRRARRRRCR